MSDVVSSRYFHRASPPHISTLILLAGLAALSMNIFLPSLPIMSEYFETDYRVMQLSVGAYLGCSAFLQLFIGPISDKLGRRPVLLWGLALFIVATLGCITAPNVEIFLVFRMAQAVIATAMVLSRAVIRDLYDDDRAASMIGYVTMGMSVVPMVGPAIGGFLQEIFGWTANFWMLVLLAALAYWITWSDLGETKARSGKTLIGQFREYPELLVSPRFWGYTLTSALSSGIFFAYLGGAPFVGSEIYGLESKYLGLVISAPAVGYMAGNYLSGALSSRFGINRMVFTGSCISGSAPLLSLLLDISGRGSVLTFFGPMVLVGLGNGMVIPNATAGALSVRPHLAGTASGLSGALMIGIGAALSAFAGTLLSQETGATPLLVLMLVCGLLGIATIAYVIRRAHKIQA
ncbi:multidrug effflux MFS transporter [Cognatishimia maritima]|uniref:Bcr/CflA family efflux transporter n=1 Tax=Cognatishimia maritima TaxID=870908 RepID=A0A1M5JUA0_9RHOB|nr:multidrug effflux MFS transporter [Cognatishimia maritima]SHG43533.1 MFS transporter, DHA1 family, bicyclomycin/chloramphenicol resistance protein [Cognatishimia maritima]